MTNRCCLSFHHSTAWPGYIQKVQRADHAVVDAMIMRSHSHVWITRASHRAIAVKSRRQAKKLGS